MPDGLARLWKIESFQCISENLTYMKLKTHHIGFNQSLNLLFQEPGEAINKDLKSFQLNHAPQTSAIDRNVATFNREAFNNYVDRILPFFYPPPPCVDSFYTLSVDKNRHFLTPPPHLVHIVIEWPHA